MVAFPSSRWNPHLRQSIFHKMGLYLCTHLSAVLVSSRLV